MLRGGCDEGKGTTGGGKDFCVGLTPLHAASKNGHAPAVRQLLQYGASADLRELSDEGSGLTPLHYACKNGHADAAAALLQAGVDINAAAGDVRTPSGSTPLHLACANGSFKLVEVLLGRHPSGTCDFEAKDGAGNTPLDIANDKSHDHIGNLIQKKIGQYTTYSRL